MRVAIFGAGYAGLGLARRLERSLPSDVDLVVVDESGTHVVRHLLHRAIRRPDVAEELTFPLSDLLERATIRETRLTDLDPEAGEATLADGEVLEYDVGAMCTGAEPAFYGLDGVAEHALTFHRPGDPAAIRSALLEAIDADGRVVIGGGGLTGIQVAGELAALAEAQDATGDVEIQLLEQREGVPPGFGQRLQTAVGDALAGAGVTVRTGVTVTGADAERVEIAEGGPIEYDCLIWAGGITGPSSLGGERPTVQANLRLSGRTFALGDAARVIDEDGTVTPATAHAAIRQAPVAATNVRRLLEHRRSGAGQFEPRLERYGYDDAGWTVSVGTDAVARVGPAILTGPAAVGVKTVVGAGYLSSVGAVREAIEHVQDAFGAR